MEVPSSHVDEDVIITKHVMQSNQTLTVCSCVEASMIEINIHVGPYMQHD